jgi:hypothetical protein
MSLVQILGTPLRTGADTCVVNMSEVITLMMATPLSLPCASWFPSDTESTRSPSSSPSSCCQEEAESAPSCWISVGGVSPCGLEGHLRRRGGPLRDPTGSPCSPSSPFEHHLQRRSLQRRLNRARPVPIQLPDGCLPVEKSNSHSTETTRSTAQILRTAYSGLPLGSKTHCSTC